MIRHLLLLPVIMVLVGDEGRSDTQPSFSSTGSEAVIAQAEKLAREVEKLYGEGKYLEAIPLAVQCLSLRERALGRTHEMVVASLNRLAELYYQQGAYAKMEPIITRALDIAEKTLGPTHEMLAASLRGIALLYKAQGAFDKAEPLLLRALDIREKAFGPNHEKVAESLNSLALLYREQAAFDKAEPLLLRAFDIREEVFGPNHEKVAESLNNLATLYAVQGAFARAEPLFLRTLDIFEKTFGPSHELVGVSLHNLALIYKAQGAYAKAEPLFLRALDIAEKILGPNHERVAANLDGLATLYAKQGAHAKAEPLFLRSLDILEKTFGSNHERVAKSLSNLAEFYDSQVDFAKAEPILLRSLDILEKALGANHKDVAEILQNLASLYKKQGDFAKAEPFLLRALNILEKALGPNHVSIAANLHNLALLYIERRGYAKAESLLARAAEIRETQLSIELPRLSELRKRALMATLQGETETRVSFHADTVPNSRSVLELALTDVLRNKGRILDSLTENQGVLRDHLTPPLRDQLDLLAQNRADLAAQLYTPPDPSMEKEPAARSTALQDRATRIVTLRSRIEDLESTLGAASAEFRVQSEPVTLAKVQAAIPHDAALVEYVRYRRFDARRIQQPWQEERYLAYVLTSRGPPQWVALGEAGPIDAQVDALLASMRQNPDADATKASLRCLDDLILEPLRGRLGNVSHLIIAPDAKLNLVPFEALLDPKGRYELENRLISYVTTGRDLLRLALPRTPKSPAVLVAVPDYGPSASDAVRGALSFLPLAGAAAEATDLASYFPGTPLTGTKATKHALASLLGPAVLHIITHGFFARDPGNDARGPISASGPQRGILLDEDIWPLPPSRSDDPADALDRAGLALTGANQGGDGIVTAREIAGFDWWGTRLVVLSACQTGVGAVPSGDGVYGLRRALVLAGVESQVVSLWNVNDSSTSELMQQYYEELASGTGRAEALRRAKLHQLRQPRHAHPYYWAAFIPAGDWRPLDPHIFKP